MQNSSIEKSLVTEVKRHHLFRKIIVKPYKNQKLKKNLKCCVNFWTIHLLLYFLYSRKLSPLFNFYRFWNQLEYYSYLIPRNFTLFWTHKILSSSVKLGSFTEISFYHYHHLIVHIHLLSFKYQLKFVINIVLDLLKCKINSNRKHDREFLLFCATVLSSTLLAYHSLVFLQIRESQHI